jgi:hypothetical protein
VSADAKKQQAGVPVPGELFAPPDVFLRVVTAEVAAAELRASVPQIQRAVVDLEESKVVTQETLQLEMSV